MVPLLRKNVIGAMSDSNRWVIPAKIGVVIICTCPRSGANQVCCSTNPINNRVTQVTNHFFCTSCKPGLTTFIADLVHKLYLVAQRQPPCKPVFLAVDLQAQTTDCLRQRALRRSPKYWSPSLWEGAQETQ